MFEAIASHMNALRVTLLVLGLVFLALYFGLPQRRRLALGYLRYVVLGVATAMVLSPFFWLLSAAFKDADVLMKYSFLPPAQEWLAKRSLKQHEVVDWARLCVKIDEGEKNETPSPSKRVWAFLPEDARLAVTQVAAEAARERKAYRSQRDAVNRERDDAIGGEERKAHDEELEAVQEIFDRKLLGVQRSYDERLAAIVSEEQASVIFAGLREILVAGDFYEQEWFATLKQSDELKEFQAEIGAGLSVQKVARLNRMLLERTFVDEMWRSRSLNTDSFVTLFRGDDAATGRIYFWQYIMNSLFLASAATVIQLFFASLAGYALAKYDFRMRKPMMMFMLASMMIPGILLLAPMYKLIYAIGWIDSYLALLVPGAVPVFGMFLFRQAIVSIPDDLIEAGRIDGCSEFAIYLNLIMPLVRPMSAAFCLVMFLGSWNSFLGPQIFLHTQAKMTLPVILNQYVGVYTQQYGVFLAGTLLAIIPPAILFFALQKEFISGLTSGAVKG